MNKVRIVLVDDHPVVLAGLGMLIRAESDFEIVGEAHSGCDALNLIRDMSPDIAIIDLSLPGMSGITLSQRLAVECPSVGIVVLTQHEDRMNLKQALDAGVRGYVLKKSASFCLVNGIRGVLVGGLYIDPAMVAHIYSPARKRLREEHLDSEMLTSRERDVLKLIASGLTAKSIAIQLGLSISTVETYKTRGSQKVGIGSRADIVRYASAQGWLSAIEP